VDLSQLLRSEDVAEPMTTTTSLVTPDTICQPVVSTLSGLIIDSVQEKVEHSLIKN